MASGRLRRGEGGVPPGRRAGRGAGRGRADSRARRSASADRSRRSRRERWTRRWWSCWDGPSTGLRMDDSTLRARVTSRFAEAMTFSPGRERGAELSEEAIAMARRLGDRPTLAYVLERAHWATWGPENLDRRMAVATEITELAEDAGDIAAQIQIRMWRLAHLLEMGDIACRGRRVRGAAGASPTGCASPTTCGRWRPSTRRSRCWREGSRRSSCSRSARSRSGRRPRTATRSRCAGCRYWRCAESRAGWESSRPA